MTSVQASVATPLASAADANQGSQILGNSAAAGGFSIQSAAVDGVAEFISFYTASHRNTQTLDAVHEPIPEAVADLNPEGEINVLATDMLPSFLPLWTQNVERRSIARQPQSSVDLPLAVNMAGAPIPVHAAAGERLASAAAASVDALSTQSALAPELKTMVHVEAPALPERNMPAMQNVIDTVHASAAGIAKVPGLDAQKVAATATGRTEQPMLKVLSQRIQIQHAQGLDVATVRLDPPQWGTLEVRIQQGPVGVQVVMQASHPEVGRQLNGMADGLRQELQLRTGGDASVVVAHSRQGANSGQGHPSRETALPWVWADEDEIGQALQA